MNLNTLNIIWRSVASKNNINFKQSSIQKCVFLKKSYSSKSKDSINSSTSKSNSSSSSSSTSSSSSDSEDDSTNKTKEDPALKNEETMTKLNSLLQQLIQNDAVAKKSSIKLARPIDKRLSKEERESRKIESVEKKLVKAVTKVAEDFGGDTKQTESELLSKLLSPMDSTVSSKSLNEIVKGMTIERETKTPEKTKADQIRNILQNIQARQNIDSTKPHIKIKQKQYRQQERIVKKIDLFGAEPLGIFTNKDLKETQLETWQKLYERDLKLAITHPPANYFQEMILWTEQGKLWKFPIDNEQGLEEKQVDFSKHIFLEEHLEPWCPQRGPLRHFMELVCVGLSKNPYLTVAAKIEHIEWFKNYFEDKKKLLQEVGALTTDSVKTKKQQQIE